MHKIKQQRGVALITAILILTLATTAAAFMISRHQIDIRRTGNVITNDQGYWYARGAESWAATILFEEFQQNNGLVVPDETWEIIVPLEEVNGSIYGKITDMQARFNINNLLAKAQGTPAKNAFAEQIFKQILQQTLPQAQPSNDIIEPILDWIDADIDARGLSGAEDNYYQGITPPYRAANHTIVSVSELRLIRNITPEIYAALQPVLTALPELTPVNVNTADALMLQALGLDAAATIAVTARRESQQFNTSDEFLNLPEVKNSPVFEVIQQNKTMLTAKSSYFLLETKVQIDRGYTTLNSIFLMGGNGQSRVIYRTTGSL